MLEFLANAVVATWVCAVLLLLHSINRKTVRLHFAFRKHAERGHYILGYGHPLTGSDRIFKGRLVSWLTTRGPPKDVFLPDDITAIARDSAHLFKQAKYALVAFPLLAVFGSVIVRTEVILITVTWFLYPFVIVTYLVMWVMKEPSVIRKHRQ